MCVCRAGVAGPVLAGPLLEIGRACACAYDEVGVAPYGGPSACTCAGKASCCRASCVFRVAWKPPCAEKGRGQALREVVYTYTELDSFSKVASMRNLKRSGSRDTRVPGIPYSLTEPRLLPLIWPEAKARVYPRRRESGRGPIVTRLHECMYGCAVRR